MSDILFDPLLPFPYIIGIAALSAVIIGIAIWRRLSGWWLRALAALCIITALSNPAAQTEIRQKLTNIVITVTDNTSSQQIANRPAQTELALEHFRQEIRSLPNTELREIIVKDAPDDQGSLLFTKLSETIADTPNGRIAGIIAITDGQLHDPLAAPDLPAPLHVMLTGQSTDWDRRLKITNAPSFGIIDQPLTLGIVIEDVGAAPAGIQNVPLEIAIDGASPLKIEIPLGQRIDLPLTLRHGGVNVLQFTTPTMEGELTDRNNTAIIQMNGVRHRLKVLLVSGEPHAGERTWRNLLKSDSAVELVHFTILRPPEKHDGVPVDELSLIAFPTRELFLEKIFDFDLIIFDRYRRRGLLPNIYFEKIREYVSNGGALLVSAGPEFATAESIYRSPIGEIIPAAPTAIVFEEGFVPAITELGQKHPVTDALAGESQEWGRWLRHIEVIPTGQSHVVMSGLDEIPLVVLDRINKGRIALIASDHSWLWDRGFEGGGPQQELLRRLAHWLMKEPELEEEALLAEVNGTNVTVIRRTLGNPVTNVTITAPDGMAFDLPLEQISNGRFRTQFIASQLGLYRISDGNYEIVTGVGPAALREYENTLATADVIKLVNTENGGAIRHIRDNLPDIRLTRAGQSHFGNGWIGVQDREAYQSIEVHVTSLVPAWLFMLISSSLIVAAWLREGRS